MRCLCRNKTTFEYLPFDSVGTDLNDDGEHTGEFTYGYGQAIGYEGNISTPSGQTNQMFYGEDVRYTHTLVMDNPHVDINEHGLIRWNGELYDITAVKPSINSISIALRKQTVGHDDSEIPDVPDTPDEPGAEGATDESDGGTP